MQHCPAERAQVTGSVTTVRTSTKPHGVTTHYVTIISSPLNINVKFKATPLHKNRVGEQPHSFLTSAIEEVGGQRHAPVALPFTPNQPLLQKMLVGPRGLSGRHREEKFYFPLWGSNPELSSTLTRRCINCAVLLLSISNINTVY